MSNKKTTLHWLNTLKEEHRDAAIANIFEDSISNLHYSLASALYNDCKWGYSPQGEGYWGVIYEQLLEGTYFDAPQHTAEGFEAKARHTSTGYQKTQRSAKSIPSTRGLSATSGTRWQRLPTYPFRGINSTTLKSRSIGIRVKALTRVMRLCDTSLTWREPTKPLTMKQSLRKPNELHGGDLRTSSDSSKINASTQLSKYE